MRWMEISVEIHLLLLDEVEQQVHGTREVR
jgi:hypothetical protein